MDLLFAISGQPPIRRGPKRKSGEITADPVLRAGLSDPNCEYTVGLWLASPMETRTLTGEFGTLISEAFLTDESATPTLPADAQVVPTEGAPPPDQEQWDDIPCPSCGTCNWYWRHCCRSCRKDSTGYGHRLSKCTCEGCSAERGWKL
jgi:hypothetical protein